MTPTLSLSDNLSQPSLPHQSPGVHLAQLASKTRASESAWQACTLLQHGTIEASKDIWITLALKNTPIPQAFLKNKNKIYIHTTTTKFWPFRTSELLDKGLPLRHFQCWFPNMPTAEAILKVAATTPSLPQQWLRPFLSKILCYRANLSCLQ